MKKVIFSILFFLEALTGFSQNLTFEVQGKYAHPISRETLAAANTMSDIIPYFPASWIKNYLVVEITSTTDGDTVKAGGEDDRLSEAQKQMLGSAVLGTEIAIHIQYQSENQLTGGIEDGEMHYSATVIPEIQAAYSYGNEQLAAYFKAHAIDQITTADSKNIERAAVTFTISDEGKVTEAWISKSSGKPEIDQLLLKAVKDMPAWNPARDSRGLNVDQQFEFTVYGNTGC